MFDFRSAEQQKEYLVDKNILPLCKFTNPTPYPNMTGFFAIWGCKNLMLKWLKVTYFSALPYQQLNKMPTILVMGGVGSKEIQNS